MSKLFDDITRVVGSKMPRRRALGLVAGGLAGGALALVWPGPVKAEGLCKKKDDPLLRPNIDIVACKDASGNTVCFCPRNFTCCPDLGAGDTECCSQKECCIGGNCVRMPMGMLAASRVGPPAEIDIVTQAAQAGIGSISVHQAINATVNIPFFPPGTTSPVTVTATKINQRQRASVLLQVCTPEGCCSIVDPVLTQLEIPQAGSDAGTLRVKERFTAIPQNESYVTVQNGAQGLKRLRVKVNGRAFRAIKLKDSSEVTLDVASEMVEGDNTITLIGYGEPGASAMIIIADVPPSRDDDALIGSHALNIQWPQSKALPGQNLTWGH